MMKKLIKDEQGVVLILVLIVLVAAIIIGVTVIRSSVLEARIAGNERRFILAFDNLETAASLFTIENTAGLIALTDSVGATYEFTHPSLPDNTTVTVTLTKIGKPPVGSKTGVTMKARYYRFDATDAATGQTITAGAYKIFPSAQ
jgi:hypothetical protein